MRRLRILTWATRPDYLRSLAQAPHELLVVSPGARSEHGDFPPNVHSVSAEEARRQKVDLILFQRPQHYLDDQYELLTAAQRRAAKVYLEHDPPREHPVDSRHVVTESDGVVRHGIDGFVEADPARLVERMQELAADRQRAALLGEAARQHAVARFGIARFVADWNRLFADLTLMPGERRAA